MDAKKEAVAAALRRQLEAQERSEERHQQELAEFYAENPDARRISETPQQRAALQAIGEELAHAWEPYNFRTQMEGFVAGWLVGTGQYEKYAELFQIWLDTMKHTSVKDREPLSMTEVSATLRTISTQPRPVERQRKRPT